MDSLTRFGYCRVSGCGYVQSKRMVGLPAKEAMEQVKSVCLIDQG